MTTEEFAALPVAIQVKLMMSANPNFEKQVLAQEAPRVPQSPKFDSRIRRKDGFVWASECDAESLRFWIKRASSGGDPQFAEKNEKEKKALEFILRWRECNPSACWSGERNREPVTARAPAAKPRINQWEPKAGDAPRATSRVSASALDGDDSSDDADAGYGF